MRTLSSPFLFRGGIHPAYHKNLTHQAPIRELPLPARLVVPLAQHLGAPARAIVKPGDVVRAGQMIGEPVGLISAPVHAPAGGRVAAIEDAPTPSGRACLAVVIETDASAEREGLPALPDWRAVDRRALIERIGAAGVVGMGGAGFPTRVKLSPPADKPIDTLILNGAECEPYLTADHRLMLERPDVIRAGAEIIRHILNARSVRIAVEDNKPDAIAALEQAFQDMPGDVEIHALATSYPQGSEKQQIFSVTGREAPRGGLPMDVGCVVENVATACAVFDAIARGEPLVRRIITVTGDAVREPANLLVPCGASSADLVAACGGICGKPAKIISGGPMMGFAVSSLALPTSKTTSGLLLISDGKTFHYTSQACIGCGRCVTACPMRLIPSELSQFIEADAIDSAQSLALLDCIECGSCAYVCPARRPLVHHMRRGKAVILARRSAEKSKKP